MAKANTGTTVKKVLLRIKRYWFFLILSILMAAVTVASSLYVPILIGNAIDYIIGPQNVEFKAITAILSEVGIVIAITALSQWIMNICNNKITYHVTRDIRDEAIEKIEVLPLKYIDGHSYGEIVSRVIADVDQFADGLLMGFTQFFTGIVTILGTLIFMLTISVKITVAVVVITPVSLLVASFIAKKTFSMFKLQSETRGEQTALIDEMIGGQKVVQAYCYEDEALERFDEINDRLQKCSLKAIFYSSITNPSTRFINSLVYAGVAVSGAISAIYGRLTVGQLSCFLSYANQYTKPFNEISGVVTELQNAIACAARIFELIEEEPEIPDSKDAVVLENVDGTVDLEHVAFSYVPDKKLIEDFNLHVKQGQRIAIVGPTGCGKTTLLRLIAGFQTASEGVITIAGKDITQTPPHKRPVNTVFQKYALFPHLNVFENVAFGLRLKKMDEETIRRKVRNMLEVVGLKGFERRSISQMSGGQQQRVAIARSLVNEPEILLLDEPLGALDLKLRKEMQLELKRLQREMNITFIYVTHDQVEAMTLADKIVVLDAGRVAQVGKPLELYHYPADRFVAGFIGSPKMNFLPVKVTATAIDQVQVELPNRQQIWLPVDSANVQAGANMSLGIRPEHLLPSDIADVTLEGEVQVVEQLGHETQIHIQIPAIRQNLVYRQNDVVLVEEGATFAIGLPPERCHLFREDGTACRRLHKEPGV